LIQQKIQNNQHLIV